MRILQLLSVSEVGGTETMVLTYLTHRHRKDFNYFLAVLSSEGKMTARLKKLGLPVASFPINSISAPLHILFLVKFIRKNEVYLIHTYGLRADLIGRLLARLAGVKVILSGVRTVGDWRKWYHHLLDRTTSNLVDLYVCNTRAAKIFLQEKYRLSASKFTVVYNGVDTDYFAKFSPACGVRRNFGIDKDSILVVMNANIRYVKGHDIVVKSLQRIISRVPQLKVLFVGQDRLNGEIQALAREDEVEHHVIFTGFRKDVHEILNEADIFLMASRGEGMPVSILEAMSMGLPIVASRVGGIPEMVEDGFNGRLFAPGNVEELAEAIIAFSQNKTLRQVYGKRSRKIVEQKFPVHQMVRKLESVYGRWASHNRSTGL